MGWGLDIAIRVIDVMPFCTCQASPNTLTYLLTKDEWHTHRAMTLLSFMADLLFTILSHFQPLALSPGGGPYRDSSSGRKTVHTAGCRAGKYCAKWLHNYSTRCMNHYDPHTYYSRQTWLHKTKNTIHVKLSQRVLLQVWQPE